MNLFLELKNIITFIFLLSILSYYMLFLIKHRKPKPIKKFSSITVIVPAHNEEEYIETSLNCILDARFDGNKEIIVIDDGSRDKTAEIVEKFKSRGVKFIRTKHSGKSASMNKAINMAKGELIAIVDADSYIEKDALAELAIELGRKNIVAGCGVVKVANRRKFLCMWPHIELVYNSLIRSLFSKINANVVTPGALSMYRTKELKEIGGFSTQGFSEDTDIAIRLIRKGYKIGFTDKAISNTNMPYDVKGFLRQRTRFARGLIDILKRHLQLNNTMIDIYTLPLFLFSYFQSVIIGSFTIYQLTTGYITYYASKGVYLSFGVLKFFFEWFSIMGFIRWSYSVFTGSTPITIITIIGIVSTLLSYPLFFFAIFKYDKKFDLLHLIPIFFMFPFWFVLMIIYTICLPEYFKKKQYNIWKKNE